MRAMRVRLLYFAVLRDITGKSEAVMDVPDGTRAADVWHRLRQQHQELAGYEKPPLAALNEVYVTAEAPLHDGDELAFIPPVAGG
jgi:molybdopterin synthase sulfur carrier subunit